MILVTVGMQLGFNRLIEAMDRFAQTHDGAILAQIGKGTYRPRHMEYAPGFEAARFDAMVEKAQLIVSHAGIGSVLAARRHGKPIVIMPRRAELGEHRNDHQLATARQLDGRRLIHVAFDEGQLAGAIGTALAQGASVPAAATTRPQAAEELVEAVRRFIDAAR